MKTDELKAEFIEKCMMSINPDYQNEFESDLDNLLEAERKDAAEKARNKVKIKIFQTFGAKIQNFEDYWNEITNK